VGEGERKKLRGGPKAGATLEGNYQNKKITLPESASNFANKKHPAKTRALLKKKKEDQKRLGGEKGVAEELNSQIQNVQLFVTRAVPVDSKEDEKETFWEKEEKGGKKSAERGGGGNGTELCARKPTLSKKWEFFLALDFVSLGGARERAWEKSRKRGKLVMGGGEVNEEWKGTRCSQKRLAERSE